MINAKMRSYEYYTYGPNNEYGQPQLSEEVQGTIKMAIYLNNRANTDTIQYSQGHYVGFTRDPNITDKYVIKYNDMNLKVLYVIGDAGKLKQIILGEM